MGRLELRTCIACAVIMASSVPLGAQTIQGRVSDSEDSRPLSGALVRLIDASGEVMLAGAADSVGHYRLEAPRPSAYRVRVEILGYTEAESRAVDARDPAATYTIDVALRRAPVPITGVEVTTDRVNRRIGQLVGTSPSLLRVRPIRREVIRDRALRGYDLGELIRAAAIPNMQVIRSNRGACYQFRQRGCLPVYLDGARMNAGTPRYLPLDMLHVVVVLLPNEVIAYPEGAVHLYTEGWFR